MWKSHSIPCFKWSQIAKCYSNMKRPWSLHWNVADNKGKIGVDETYGQNILKKIYKTKKRTRINTSSNGFFSAFYLHWLHDFNSSHFLFCFSWFIFILFLHFIWIVFFYSSLSKEPHPERTGDDECASPKWLQSIVISGCRYFLRGAHQSFIIGCQSGWDGVERG